MHLAMMAQRMQLLKYAVMHAVAMHSVKLMMLMHGTFLTSSSLDPESVTLVDASHKVPLGLEVRSKHLLVKERRVAATGKGVFTIYSAQNISVIRHSLLPRPAELLSNQMSKLNLAGKNATLLPAHATLLPVHLGDMQGRCSHLH